MSFELDFNVEEVRLQIEMMKSDLQNKKELALQRICERLMTLIEAYSNNVVADDIYRVNRVGKTYAYIPATKLSDGFECDYRVGKDKATVRVNGEDLFFIEFGAGYGADGLNPLSSEVSFSTARGSYGNHNGLKDFWFFKDNGETIMAKGTPSSKPISKAIEQVQLELPNILRGVFE